MSDFSEMKGTGQTPNTETRSPEKLQEKSSSIKNELDAEKRPEKDDSEAHNDKSLAIARQEINQVQKGITLELDFLKNKCEES